MVNHRAALEQLWKDQCTVWIWEKHTDPTTGITDFAEVLFLENQSCKLSFDTISAVGGDGVAAISQAVKLFLSPEIAIPPGAKISVTRQGQTTEYAGSGQPARFSNHQEIKLELFRGWA